MEREIKFRGQRVDNGEWIYGSLVLDNYGGNPSIIDYANQEKESYSWHDVISETVGQFTCLKDKNGKEIYEGDIMEYTQHYFNLETTDKKSKVIKWNVDRWNVSETNAGQDNFEIIGNIHENPELIKT